MEYVLISQSQFVQINRSDKLSVWRIKCSQLYIVYCCLLCIKRAFLHIAGSVVEESLSDKVLTRCEVLKRAVHDILDAYNSRDKDSNKSKLKDQEKN